MIHLSLIFFPFWREKYKLIYHKPIKDFPPPPLNKLSLNVPLVSSLGRHLMYDKLSLRGNKYIFPIIFFPLQTSKKLKYHGNENDKSPRHWNLSVPFIHCKTEAQKAKILCIKAQNKPMTELRGGKKSQILSFDLVCKSQNSQDVLKILFLFPVHHNNYKRMVCSHNLNQWLTLCGYSHTNDLL